MSLKTPTVTIGIPVYNREELLPKTLDCLLKQTFQDFEILISDNASTDNTQAVCLEYADKDVRIRYVRQEKNLGILGNFTYVKDHALGKYFMWCASDDLCEPEFVDSMVNCLDAHPELALVMTDIKTVIENGQVIHTDRMAAIRKEKALADLAENRRLFFNYGDPNHLYHCIFGLYRTDIAKQCHLPRKTWRGMIADLEVPMLAQVAVKGGIASIPGTFKTYCSHGESTYVKEVGKRSVLDKAMRGLEVRTDLVKTAFVNDLPWNIKLQLLKRFIASSVWSVSNFIKGKSSISDATPV